jgi:hypothetical protein
VPQEDSQLAGRGEVLFTGATREAAGSELAVGERGPQRHKNLATPLRTAHRPTTVGPRASLCDASVSTTADQLPRWTTSSSSD